LPDGCCALQGSDHAKVHVHADRFKPMRNNMYTACTRPKEALAISGIKDEADLRAKVELHPESVLMEHELMGAFSPQRVAEARKVRRQQRAAAAGM